MSEPNAKVLLSREEDSHPQASGRLMVWRSSELDANRVVEDAQHVGHLAILAGGLPNGQFHVGEARKLSGSCYKV